jgi:hypothetical protein
MMMQVPRSINFWIDYCCLMDEKVLITSAVLLPVLPRNLKASMPTWEEPPDCCWSARLAPSCGNRALRPSLTLPESIHIYVDR